MENKRYVYYDEKWLRYYEEEIKKERIKTVFSIIFVVGFVAFFSLGR